MALSVLPSQADKRAAVRAMFDRIAPRYDALNRLLTAGLDQRWRRAALALVDVGPGDRVLDLACGTGDFSQLALARGARAIGLDFAGEMLHRARRRVAGGAFVQGDGAALPLADGVATVAACGFALRNFVSLPEIFAELARVLAPRGRLVLLEVDRPQSALVRGAHAAYFDRVVPLVGGLLSDRAAYAYLPQSTVYLPDAARLLGALEKAGFERLRRKALLLGAVQILTGVRR
jgi:demethylmenaquinone methyltransferase/2-methoxy-6-polyprenyl-1,4-benzoquinol methylase